jgi:Na+/phosphate symporter
VNSSNRVKAISYALALLIFGGIIGAMMKSAMPATPQTLRVGRADEIEAVILERLDSKLALTPEQKQRMKPLIKKAAEEMEASHLDCLKRVNKAVDTLHDEIKPELLPEQVQKLGELEADRAARMKEKYNYPQSASNAGQH